MSVTSHPYFSPYLTIRFFPSPNPPSKVTSLFSPYFILPTCSKKICCSSFLSKLDYIHVCNAPQNTEDNGHILLPLQYKQLRKGVWPITSCFCFLNSSIVLAHDKYYITTYERKKRKKKLEFQPKVYYNKPRRNYQRSLNVEKQHWEVEIQTYERIDQIRLVIKCRK